MSSVISAKETRVTLRKIVGLRLHSSRTFLATRHFYFGKTISQTGPGRLHYTLGFECAWRIHRSGLIIVGSEDYGEEAEGKADPSWEPGMPGGLQDQKLTELLGERKEARVINTRPGFVVEAVEFDRCGGIRIELGRRYVLEAFPASAKQLEWIFMPPGGRSLVLMNGVVNKCKKPAGAERGKRGGKAGDSNPG
jgi:hypothetical protein